MSDKSYNYDRLKRIGKMVAEQAEDAGLWFDAQTAPEVYLQQALRRLHKLIEEDVYDSGPKD